MNIRLTPEDILTFYKRYGKLPDAHLFAPEDLKEFFTLLHLENREPSFSMKSKKAIWEKTQTKLNIKQERFLNFWNIFKVGITALVAGTGVFFVANYIQNQQTQNIEIALNDTNTAIDSLLSELDTSYFDENIPTTIDEDENISETENSKMPSFFEKLIQQQKNNLSKNNEIALNLSPINLSSPTSQNENQTSKSSNSTTLNTNKPSETENNPSQENIPNLSKDNNTSIAGTENLESQTQKAQNNDLFSPTFDQSSGNDAIKENAFEGLQNDSIPNPTDSTTLSRNNNSQENKQNSVTTETIDLENPLHQISQLKAAIREDSILEEIQNNLSYLNSLTF